MPGNMYFVLSAPSTVIPAAMMRRQSKGEQEGSHGFGQVTLLQFRILQP